MVSLKAAICFILVAGIFLALSWGPATEHLNGVCEQSATSCLMAKQTHCITGSGAISNAHSVVGKQTHAILDMAEPNSKAATLDLALLLIKSAPVQKTNTLKTDSHRKKKNSVWATVYLMSVHRSDREIK